MKLLENVKKIEEIIKKYDLGSVLIDLRNEIKEFNYEELKKAIEEKSKIDRELKIGFIGRVKAGKSSLLNSLVFDGEEVLPKAATPMTAALTVLKYGNEMSAKIEFFTRNDIENLKEKYLEYRRIYDKLYDIKMEEIREKLKSKNKILSPTELENRVKKSVLRELKNYEDLQAAYEQYEKIKETNFNVETLENTIKASNLKELNEKLKEYVSSNGKYMPYTKSVTLTLKKDSLKNLEIIDTPGVNDPVISREERTRELLKNCDVVFIVSPSGQFLTQEDLTLFDRVTSKEGIQEVYLIASQVDNQLFGSERREDLYEALELIAKKLTSYAKSVFEKDEFLRSSLVYQYIKKNKVLLSSAMAYSIYRKLDRNLPLSENESHIFNLLKTFYKDFFTSNAKENLYKLSNLEVIRGILEDVRRRKEEIQKQNLNQFLESKEKSLNNLINEIRKGIEEKIVTIQNADLEKLKKDIDNLKKIEEKAKIALEDEFEELIDDLRIGMKEKLFEKLDDIFSQAKRDINANEDTETETWTETRRVKQKGVFGGFKRFFGSLLGQDDWGYDEKVITHTETYTIAYAGIIRNSLEESLDFIQNIIDLDSKKYIKEWRKSVYKKLIRVLRNTIGDDNLEVNTLKRALRKVVNSVEFPDIVYSGLPSSLKKSGTLKGSSAERFLDEAREFVNNLQYEVKKDINNYLENLTYKLSKLDISEEIFKTYHKEMEKLQKEIENKELTLKRYKKILEELNIGGFNG